MGEYRDRDGNACTLEQMVRWEPEWAAMRIRDMEAELAGPGSPARQRLVAAIRTLTVDATDEQGDPLPNGPTEEALGKLLDSLHPDQVDLAAEWLSQSAGDVRELRLAAEAYLGGDFLATETPPGDGS